MSRRISDFISRMEFMLHDRVGIENFARLNLKTLHQRVPDGKFLIERGSYLVTLYNLSKLQVPNFCVNITQSLETH